MPNIGPRGSAGRRPCTDFAEQRSALVDGALPDADRERLLRHLVDCRECRDDIEELRRIRDLLRRSTASTSQTAMADRLISIAGAEADVPLWSRPFDRPADRRLPPSRRRARRRTFAATVASVLAVGVSVVGVGWVAAPQAGAKIDDPAAGSAAEFASTLAQLPLTSPETTAALATDLDDLLPTTSPAPLPASPAQPTAVNSAEAADALTRAVGAAGQLNYRGEAEVSLGQGRERILVQVDVIAQSGQGLQLTVRRSDGWVLNEGFLPLGVSTRMPVTQSTQQLVQGLALTGVSGARVAGRSATVVTADGAGGARRTWWIDDETGMLLWQATFDATGSVISSAGFTSVTISDQPFLGHLAPRLTVGSMSASLTLGSAARLVDTGWFCAGWLDGLELVRVRTDSQSTPGVVQTVYTDGVSVVSVIQQHGRLGVEPTGFTMVDGVWLRDTGGLRFATWQSGDTVITVITDGPIDLLSHAQDQLPPVRPLSDSNSDRVRAGWSRIYHLVMG